MCRGALGVSPALLGVWQAHRDNLCCDAFSLVQAHTCRPTRGSEGSESVRVFVLMGAVLVTLFWTC